MRSYGTALTVAREVSAVTGAVRCGAEDYLRLLVGMKDSGPKSASMLTPKRLTSRCSSILSRGLRGEADFKRGNFHRGPTGPTIRSRRGRHHRSRCQIAAFGSSRAGGSVRASASFLFDLMRCFRNRCDGVVTQFFSLHTHTKHPTSDEVAVGAYHVWEKESRPSGRESENWLEAETQLTLFPREPDAKPPIRPDIVPARYNNPSIIESASPMPGIGKRGKTRQPRVLVIDDEPFATHMLGGLLRKYGYIAAELNDPTKALQMAERFLPDIVLLDIHMPWKDGYEVAAEFGSNPFQCDIPIIYITHDASDRNNPTSSIPILVKPFSIEDFFAYLKKGMERFATPV